MRAVRHYRNVWGCDNFLYLLSWEMQAYSKEKPPAGISSSPRILGGPSFSLLLSTGQERNFRFALDLD